MLLNALLLRVECRRHGASDGSRKAHQLMLAEAGPGFLNLWWAAGAVALAGAVLMPIGVGAQFLGGAVVIAVGASLFRFERAWIRAAQKIPNS